MLNEEQENSEKFDDYFLTLYKSINIEYINTKNSKNSKNIMDILKIYEKKVLFDILYLCPTSISRVTKSHRKANDNKLLLINSNALSYCNIENNVKVGSYIDIDNKKIIHIKSDSISSVEYDLSKIWESIQNLINFKKLNKLSMYLFTDENGQYYPLYYKNSIKKHCGFQNASYKLIKQEFLNKFDNTKINNIFKKITSLNQIFKKISICNLTFEEYANSNESLNLAIESEVNYNNMWKEIFETIGMLPKDCECKAYGSAVYNRCVINGKKLRGIRPKHSKECSKKIINN